ncbi:MAG: autotransporter-associated beta strand repeat-containing protein, partial [Armatimonadetes bacterium]|nr:autotransporter-associated beta strand repeat-containing protein [Armatimonadota bacterium]
FWDGGGANDNWGTAANWSPDGAPANDVIHMAGIVRTTPIVNVPWCSQSLVFDAGTAAFTVSGSTLTINNNTGVQNMSSNLQTVNAPITLAVASNFDAYWGNLAIGGAVNNGGFLLTFWGLHGFNTTISGAISGNGGLTKTENGTLRLSGATANNYTGTTTVNQGTLELAKTVLDGAIKGPLVIGDGVGGPNADVVRIMVNNQIDPSSSVSILNSGLLDLNSFASAIGSLSMTGGAITTGTGTLSLNGHVTGNADASTATISGKVGMLGMLHQFTIADGTAAIDMDISAVLSTGSLTKTGTGTLRFSGTAANTYTGLTTVSNGTLLLGKSFDTLAVAGDLAISSAGTPMTRTPPSCASSP